MTPPQSPGTHRTQPGETLQLISAKHYGTTKLWSKLYQANMSILNHPSSLTAGMDIVLVDDPRLKNTGYEMGKEEMVRLGFTKETIPSTVAAAEEPQMVTSGMRKRNVSKRPVKLSVQPRHGVGDTYNAIEPQSDTDTPAPMAVSVRAPIEGNLTLKARAAVHYGDDGDEPSTPPPSSPTYAPRAPSSNAPPPQYVDTPLQRFDKIEL